MGSTLIVRVVAGLLFAAIAGVIVVRRKRAA